MNEEKIIEIIYKSISELNKNELETKKIPLNLDVKLIGSDGYLDSMAFAIFISTLERCFFEDINLKIDFLDSIDNPEELFRVLESPQKISEYINKILKSS
tara:strand:- start:195 stop:494 length:300 start_codon:yes stop_codon:yes gene_type:complete